MKTLIAKGALVLLLSASISACNFLEGGDDEMENQAPEASPSSFTTQADIAINDTVTAYDANMDMLTFSVQSEPENGSLSLSSNGDFTYTPSFTFTGTDMFSFSVSDGQGGSDSAVVMITIESQQVSFSSYSRTVFSQDERDVPLPTNGREFTQDVEDPDAYDDLLINP